MGYNSNASTIGKNSMGLKTRIRVRYALLTDRLYFKYSDVIKEVSGFPEEDDIRLHFLHQIGSDFWSSLDEVKLDNDILYSVPSHTLSHFDIGELEDKRVWKSLENKLQFSQTLRKEQQEIVDLFFDIEKRNQSIFDNSNNQSELNPGIIQAKCGWGKCKPYFSKILTSKGLLSLEELKEEIDLKSIEITNVSGQYPINLFYDNGLEEYYVIYTNQGHEVTGTAKHPLLVYNTNTVSIEYKQISELKLGDNLVGSIDNNLFGTHTIDDPYLIGLLIGDGSLTLSNKIGLSSGDIEVQNYFKNWVKLHSINNLCEYAKENHIDYVITDKKLYNDYVLKYKLNTKSINKIICKELRQLTREQTILLLQGLFDTDGSAYNTGKIDFCSSSDDIAEYVLTQLNNLGIIATRTRKLTAVNPTNVIKINSVAQCKKFYDIIGFKIQRKQDRKNLLSNTGAETIGIYKGLARKLYDIYKNSVLYNKGYSKVFSNYKINEISKNKLSEVLTIFSENNIDYPSEYDILNNTYCLPIKHIRKKEPIVTYDISVNHPSHSFVSEGVINHNTFTACAITARASVSTLVLVHTKLLFNQWIEEFKKQIPGIPIGMIGDGIYDPQAITVGIYKSVNNNLEHLRYNFSLVIVDECHLCPAEVFSHTLNGLAAKVKIGISATPRRKDGKHALLEDFFSNYKCIAKDTRLTTKPEIRLRRTDIPFFILNPKRDWTKALGKLASNSTYIDLIAGDAINLISRGRCLLILSERLEMLRQLKTKIPNSTLIIGETSKEERDDVLKNAGIKYDCLLSTRLFDEGISCHRLDTLLLPCPNNNPIKLEQRIGRIEREHPDKLTPLVIDYWLKGAIVQAQQARRLLWYQSQKMPILE
jgi:hypothetical protein